MPVTTRNVELIPAEELRTLQEYAATLNTLRSGLDGVAGPLERAASSASKFNASMAGGNGRTFKARQIISEKELSNMDAGIAKIAKYREALAGMLPDLQAAAKGMQQVWRDPAELEKRIAGYAAQAEQAAAAARNYSETVKQVEASQRRLAAAQSDAAKQTAVNKEQVRQLNYAYKVQAQEVLAVPDSLNALRAELKQASIDAANLKLDTPEYAAASQRVAELTARVSEYEQAMGKFSRNVGNYAGKTFNGLQFSIQQVVRELPSLKIGLNTFFLAISNNLPIVADQIKMVREENRRLLAEAAAAGQAAPKITSVGKQIVKSLLSWQSALVAGITLITLYGDKIIEWIGNLFKGRKALDAAAKALELYNRAMAEGARNAADELAKLQSLRAIIEDVGNSMDRRREAYEELLRLYPEYFGNLTQEEVMAGNIAAAYDKVTEAILRKAKAEAAQDMLAESLKKELLLTTTGIDTEALKAARERLEAAYERGTAARGKRDRLHAGLADGTAQPAERPITFAELAAATAEMEAATAEMEAAEQEFEELRSSAWEALRDGMRKGSEEEVALFKEIRDEYGKDVLAFIDTQNALSRSLLDTIADNLEITPSGGGSGRNRGRAGAKSDKDPVTDYERELALLRLNIQAAAQKKIMQDEGRSYEERAAALRAFLEKMREIENTETEYRREDAAAQLAAGEITEQAYADRIEIIRLNNGQNLASITEDGAATEVELVKWRGEQLVDAAERSAAEQAAALTREQRAQMAETAAMYAAGALTQEQYERRQTEIMRRGQDDRFASTKANLEELLALTLLTEEQKAAVRQKLAELIAEHEQEQHNRTLEDYEREAQLTAEIEAKKQELITETFELAKTLSDAAFERQAENLEKLSEANEKWKDAETERIERLADQDVISKEQAEARKNAVDEQAAARQEELERKKVEMQRRQAVFNRGLSIMQLGYSLAESIMKIWAAWGALPAKAGVLTALVSGIAAAQMASVIATPIPQYARGTEDHPGGLAVVGDGGRRELVMLPGGRAYSTPAVPTLVDLPEHTVVLPDYMRAVRNAAPLAAPASPLPHTYDGVLADLYATLRDGNKLSRRMLRGMEYDRRHARRRSAVPTGKTWNIN